jgi:hypothetical protein
MSKNSGVTKLVLGAVAVVAGIGGLVIVALGGSTVATVPFADVAKSKEKVEIYGKLDKSSIRPIRGANYVAFDILEEVGGKEDKHLTGRRLAVMYQNPSVGLPANFPAASHARAAGMYDPTTRKLISDRVYTKCPSKYEENGLDAETKVALKAWKDATVNGKVESVPATSGKATGTGAPAAFIAGVRF